MQGSVPKSLKRVLVIDDYFLNRELAVDLVKMLGFSVDAAATSSEAMTLFLKYHYDLVLMDIEMPGMDGYQLTEEIRKVKKEIKIVAFTAYAMPGDKEKCLNAGMDDYLSKPVEIDQFERILLKHLDENLNKGGSIC
ncbi:response regulator [Estrella lausannensis]|uniref:Two-component system, response regulator n=1 Tax=Estrella lausannensis TaxID=483423 RepID=A0A0H5DNW3_9BACT|nr:response regulator [Estrella lausannensis]CRX38096.1 two-component system, response regulator [Estrella lausannensis]